MQRLVKIILNLFSRKFLIKTSLLLKPFLELILTGNKFHDPINNKSYSYFFPYGYNKLRKNALSPGTLSLERHRLLWVFLENETDFFNKSNKILHIAPEQCFHKNFKKNFISYITCDLNSPLAEIKADVCDLPFEENEFDYVLCNHVLEHVYDDNKAMREIYRVLKFEGKAILQVPINNKLEKTIDGRNTKDVNLRNKLFGQYDHLRSYGLDYYNKLTEVGFKVEKIDQTKKMDESLIRKYSLVKGEIIPYCTKI